MIKDIGEASGEIYRFLEKNGPQFVDDLRVKLFQDDDLLNRAIGWLAREAKIVITMEGDREVISIVGM
jgi:hypothetical protein